MMSDDHLINLITLVATDLVAGFETPSRKGFGSGPSTPSRRCVHQSMYGKARRGGGEQEGEERERRGLLFIAVAQE